MLATSGERQKLASPLPSGEVEDDRLDGHNLRNAGSVPETLGRRLAKLDRLFVQTNFCRRLRQGGKFCHYL